MKVFEFKKITEKDKRYSLIAGISITTFLFLSLALTQYFINGVKPESEYYKVNMSIPPPPPPDEDPPPPEPEEEETPPELDTSPPPLNLAELEASLNVGTGDISGDFALPSFDARKTNLGMDIFDINDLEKKPQPRRQLPPRYPSKAKANGIEGFVLAEFIVDQNGDVESVVIKDSSHSLFEAPTIDAIRNWVFTPGEKDGRKVRTRVRVKIPYTLQ
jgi:protein TonB